MSMYTSSVNDICWLLDNLLAEVCAGGLLSHIMSFHCQIYYFSSRKSFPKQEKETKTLRFGSALSSTRWIQLDLKGTPLRCVQAHVENTTAVLVMHFQLTGTKEFILQHFGKWNEFHLRCRTCRTINLFVGGNFVTSWNEHSCTCCPHKLTTAATGDERKKQANMADVAAAAQ